MSAASKITIAEFTQHCVADLSAMFIKFHSPGHVSKGEIFGSFTKHDLPRLAMKYGCLEFTYTQTLRSGIMSSFVKDFKAEKAADAEQRTLKGIDDQQKKAASNYENQMMYHDFIANCWEELRHEIKDHYESEKMFLADLAAQTVKANFERLVEKFGCPKYNDESARLELSSRLAYEAYDMYDQMNEPMNDFEYSDDENDEVDE
jgi:hypothetical protein